MNLSLRGRLVLAALFPLVLFGVLATAAGVGVLTTTATELALQRQKALTSVAAAGVASNLQSWVRALDTAARDVGPLTGNQEKQQQSLLDNAASLNAFSAVVLLDGEGRVIATSPPGTATAGFAFADQQFFRAARAVQSTVYSDVFLYQPTGLPVVVAALPVRNQGAFTGVLVGGFGLARPEWARDLNLVRTSGGSIAYLVDSAGNVIYRPGADADGATIRSNPDLRALAASGTPGGRIYRPNSSEEETVATYAPVGGTGWGLIIEEPWQPIVAPLVPAQLLVAGLVGLGVLVALLALTLSLGRALRPLRALVEEGRRVAAGQDFRPLPEKGPPDLRSVLRAVNQMVARLGEQQQALRNYAAEVLRAQEEERLRLARELHDGAVQDLVALGQRLELYQDERQAGAATAASRLQEVQALASKSIVELRRMSNNLRPSILEDLGLVPALRLLVKELGQQIPLAQANFEVVGEEVRLPGQLELTIFRLAQEALANVHRHAAAARRVNVALVFEPGEVTLVVEDDGPGFKMAEAEVLLREGHLGLAGMAERARLVGGRLEVDSAPGKGTTVIVRLPVAGAA